MKYIRKISFCSLLALFFCAVAVAGDHPVTLELSQPPESAAPPQDLHLTDLFSTGWNQDWVKRHRSGAPDLTLLRVQTNQLLRSARTDYFFERMLETSSARDIQVISQLVEYAVNRRLMLAVSGNYEWIDRRHTQDENGGAWGGLVRLQLIDTEHASYALNFRAISPNEGLDEKQTTTAIALAGWHDLSPLGLGKTGFYWHAQGEVFPGPREQGAKRSDLTLGVSLARTWTGGDATLGNLTTFVEGYGRSDLDGTQKGKLRITVTPGVRCTLAKHHIVMAGLDIPVTEPRPYQQIFRFTYIYSF